MQKTVGVFRQVMAAALLGIMLLAGIVSQAALAAAPVRGADGSVLLQATDTAYPPPGDETDYPAPGQPTNTVPATSPTVTPTGPTPTPGGPTPTLSTDTAETPTLEATSGTTTPAPNLFQTENAQMGLSQATAANSQTVLPTMTATFFTPTTTTTTTVQPTRFTVTPSPTPRPPSAALVNWQIVGFGVLLPVLLLVFGFVGIAIYQAGYRAGQNAR